MQGTAVSADTQALLLLCSRLGLSADVKPLSLAEWNRVATEIAERQLRPADLLGQSAAALSDVCAVDSATADRMAALLDRGGQLALELERLASRGIWAISRADDDYPRRWKQRLRQAAPVVLFGAGAPPPSSSRTLAIVGSRDVDTEALAFTTELARVCVKAEVVVVSGGARGTDMAALLGAIDAGGQAVAVLADSLEQSLRKKDLVNRIRAGRLTLLSSEHPSRPFSVGVAMARNKLIYALGDWAVVISSAAESGGTWAGATEALRHGWVPVFARDQPSVPDGNRLLLQRGALPIRVTDLATGDSLLMRLTAYVAETAVTTPVARETPSLFGAESGASEAESSAMPPSEERPAPGPSDVYTLVVDALVQFCATARSAEEVAAGFAIEPVQARAWLARAVKEKRLRKRVKPVRYEAADSVDLFGFAQS
jgi:predicted Rossmann fold nucleotide-binding protein DprA/Smf involved in DNA uptake